MLNKTNVEGICIFLFTITHGRQDFCCMIDKCSLIIQDIIKVPLKCSSYLLSFEAWVPSLEFCDA